VGDLSFDHLVGAGEQRRRHSEAKRIGSFQVDHQSKGARRLLKRQISGPRAFEDAIDKSRCA
jgi:hypothetical protein